MGPPNAHTQTNVYLAGITVGGMRKLVQDMITKIPAIRNGNKLVFTLLIAEW